MPSATRGDAESAGAPNPSVPFIVGAVGHRTMDSANAARIERLVGDFLNGLRAHLPETELVILCSLAEGADRLVARVALSQGARLIVPAPMGIDEYRNTFESDESREEFEALIARAELVVFPAGTVTHPDPADRDALYARTGRWIAHACHILVALWDGMPGSHTADAVRAKRASESRLWERREASVGPVLDSGIVYHVVTPRPGTTKTSDMPDARVLGGNDVPDGDDLAADAAAETIWRTREGEAFRQLSEFNALSRRLLPALSGQVAAAGGLLWPDHELEILDPAITRIRVWFAQADSLATHYSQGLRRHMVALFVVVGLSIVCLELYAHLFHDRPVLLIGYPGLLAIALVWMRRTKLSSAERRSHDYRALAEGLRVQFYWYVAGLRASVSAYYLALHRTELDWIRMTIGSLLVTAHAGAESRANASTLDAVRRHWIESQLAYFGRTAPAHHRIHERLATYSDWFFLVSAASAVVLGMQQIFSKETGGQDHQAAAFPQVMITVCGLMLAAAALLHGYLQQRGYLAMSRRYEMQARLFAGANAHLTELLREGDVTGGLHVVHELGREAVTENGDWLLLHRDRPIEMPKP